MNKTMRISTLLAAGICAGAWTALAPAQQRPASNAAYDAYEPSARLAGRKQLCMQDEEIMGANCVKKCQTGYEMDLSAKAPRCRSVKPLPPGTPPPPFRKQEGKQNIPHLPPGKPGA